MTQDLRFGWRMLVRTPGFSLIAVLTIGLGIGANTAIFGVIHALLLKPLPYPDAGKLVMLWQDLTARGGPATEWATPGNFFDWQSSRAFAGVAAVQGWPVTLTGIAEPEPLVGEQVTPDYFEVLGVPPAIGRTFRSEEGVPNARRVVVLGHALWQRRFGGDPAVVGRPVILGGEPHEVVGVMPAAFRPAVVPAAELWRPRQLNATNPSRGAVILRVVARLQAGVTLEEARTSAKLLAQQLERAHPQWNVKAGINIIPLHEQLVGNLRRGLVVLLGAVSFVLLIACVNIANLLLARASGRRREMAVRIALGAGSGRVLRQLLTESVLLAALGGVLGILFAVWGIAALVAVAPAGSPRLDEVALNPTVLAYAAGLTLLTGIVFGLVPALQATRADVAPAFRESGRITAGAAGHAVRRVLIVAEVALAVVLLAGSGLLMRTFVRLQAADLGFNPEGVVVGAIVPTQDRYPTPASRVALYDRLLERVSALPGVRSAALSSVVPLGGDSDMTVFIEGRPLPRTEAETLATWYRLVSAGYLETMGIALRKGRGIVERDPAPVVVVSETAARRFWPGADPIGKRVRFGTDDQSPWFTVIGVVDDVKMRGARGDARAEMYAAYWHYPEAGTNIVVKTAGDPAAVAPMLRRAVREVDPDMPVARVTPMTEIVSTAVSQPRFLALVAATFGALALALAAVGIYGVMSYLVAQRTVEIGVRVALGAERQDVFRLVVGDGLKLAALGSALGMLGAAALGRSIESLLFGVAARDPLTFGATTATLLSVAALASLLPARRAMRVDPMAALRAE